MKMHPLDVVLKVIWIIVGVILIVSVFTDAF
jgi:hypothetical protein